MQTEGFYCIGFNSPYRPDVHDVFVEQLVQLINQSGSEMRPEKDTVGHVN